MPRREAFAAGVRHPPTILDVVSHLRRLKEDPWADVGRLRQRLPDAASAGASRM